MAEPSVRTYVITGASSGIGAQFARSCAGRGWNLVLVARRLDRLETLAAELRNSHSVAVTCIAADLGKQGDVDHLLVELKNINIQIDGLINNAGYSLARTFANTSAEQQMDFLQVCVSTPTYLAHRLLAHMLQQGFGRIINVSSMVAFSPGAAGHTLYPAAKAYMLKFSRSLNAEVAAKGVFVTALCPGSTESEFQQANGMTEVLKTHPARFVQSAQSVVDAALRANEKGREVVITGWLNQLAVAAMTLLPDALVTPLIRWGAQRYQLHD